MAFLALTALRATRDTALNAYPHVCCMPPQEFIQEGVEWSHLDIAGTAWNDKEGLATGYGAALLAEWATAQGSQ